MNKILIYIGLLLLLLSCKNNNENIKLIYFEATNNTDSLPVRLKEFYTTPRSWNASHLNVFISQSKSVGVALNSALDTIIVDNLRTGVKERFSLPKDLMLPVSSIYFHNYDSIFLFFNASDIYHLTKYKINHPFFILTDTSSKIINTYGFQNIPYIYKGKLKPSIFLKPGITKQNRIKNGKFYLPFEIYLPQIFDVELKDYHIQLLCEYDLSSKTSKMIEICIPDEDIGKRFLPEVVANTIEFTLFQDKIIYGYPYTSKLYVYSLKNRKLVKTVKYPKFFFDNKFDNDTINQQYVTYFSSPVFIDSLGWFSRRIQAISLNYQKNSLNYNKIVTLTQILDKNLDLIGYNFDDSIYEAAMPNIYGGLTIKHIKDNIYYKAHFSGVKSVNKQLISEKYGSLKSKPIKTNGDLSAPIKKRMANYFESLNINKGSRIVTVNSNIHCFECVNFILNDLKENHKKYGKKNIYFVFYGDNINIILNLLNSYYIPIENHVIVDINQNYKNYFKSDEFKESYFINFGEKNLSINKYDYEDVGNKYKSFLDNK